MALSGLTNTYIVAGVGVVVIILFSVLGWVVYPNAVDSVCYLILSSLLSHLSFKLFLIINMMPLAIDD